VNGKANLTMCSLGNTEWREKKGARVAQVWSRAADE
jgi:hypothetical protein